MGISGTAYKLFFLGHIVCAIVGFGGVVLNGLYGYLAKQRTGTDGLAIVEANDAVSELCAKFIYAVPVFGFGMVFLSDGVWSFHQTWLWLALAIYVGALGLSHGVMKPTVKRMITLMKEMVRQPVGPDGQPIVPDAAPAGPPPQAAEMATLGQRAAATGAVLNGALVVVLILMIWKPGV